MKIPEVKAIPFAALEALPRADRPAAEALLQPYLARFGRKIVVLDDDPTGVQTVHDISVYTDWSEQAILDGFREKNSMFFVLTNSRSFSAKKTEEEHRKMAENILVASVAEGKPPVIISRSDSTLRGHYPLEPGTLRSVLEQHGQAIDGEVIYPFFQEGGRYTLHGVHYVKEGDQLIPAGQTEFARDKSFGYENSHLGLWVQEKTGGDYRAEDMVYIDIDSLRAMDVEGIARQLQTVTGFGKVIVDSADYADVYVFAAALLQAMEAGKTFMIRSAAAITKVLGGVPDRPLLTREDIVSPGDSAGGMIIVGSHVNKTSRQLEALRMCRYPIEFVEFNQHLVLEEGGLAGETERVSALCDALIHDGNTVAVYTRRDRFDLPEDSGREAQLRISTEISDALANVVTRLRERPAFLIAKGGITSSDVGTKSLNVYRATVMGQVLPGVPVWKTGAESKFPDLAYVIFPGNVGDDDSLKDIVESLMQGSTPRGIGLKDVLFQSNTRRVDRGRTFLASFGPGEDVLLSMEALVKEQGITDAVFTAGAGDLDCCSSHITIREPDGKFMDHPIHWEHEPMTLSGVSGFIEKGRCHLHGVVGNDKECCTAHFHEGCIVGNSVKIVVTELIAGGED